MSVSITRSSEDQANFTGRVWRARFDSAPWVPHLMLIAAKMQKRPRWGPLLKSFATDFTDYTEIISLTQEVWILEE